MSKRNLVVDVALCENCHNCTLAARDEHVGNDFPGYAAPQPLHGPGWITIERRVRGSGTMVDAAYLPKMCNHCDDAPCLAAAGDSGAVRKRADGIVIVDPDKARGRRDLVDACPYGAIVWNEELELPQAWTFDAHLLDAGWSVPRCEQSCPTGALRAVTCDDDAMRRRAEREGLEVLKPELGTRPRVWYRNLHRYTKQFVGGTVVAPGPHGDDCVEGAEVTLARDGAEVARERTDAFGNFKFDGLESDSGTWQLAVSHPEHGTRACAAEVGQESVNLGVLRLAG